MCAYFLKDKVKDNAKNVIVYDLGGGTFDVSVLTLDDGIFEVLSTTGNSALGGQDFDQNLMNYILGNYIKRTGNRDVMSDSKAIQKLRREVERAKRTLSSYPDSIIEVEDFYSGHDLKEKITRTEFEKINNKLFDSTLDKIKEVLKDAKLRAKEIDDVLLVGGSTRIPYIRELIKNYFSGRSPRIDVHPDEAVAFGAAIQGGILQKHESFKDVILLDINSLTLGIEASTGLMSVLLKRGSRIPGKKSAIHSTAKDNQENVDIKVYEGERPVAKDNHLLGSFVLDEIPPAPRGVPQIEVTFEIDANGILEVTAKDLLTRKSESRIIANSKNRMQSEDIQRMIQVAIKFKKQDDKQRERIKAHSDLEAMVYSFKKLLASNEEIKMKLSKEKFEALQKSVEDIITWLEKDSTKDADRYEFVQVRTRLEKNIQMFADEWKLRELQIWIQETQSKINNSTGNRSGHDEL